jgi:hypothetical protein
MASITVSYLRTLEDQYSDGKITYSHMVELINERAAEGSGEVPKDCIPKADLLAHLDKLIEGAQKQEATFKEAEMDISELTSGAMAMAYQIVRNFIGRQAPEIEAAKSKLDPAALQAQYENVLDQMRPEYHDAICNVCKHQWKIELPALYKETFCPNCGE